MPEHRKKFWRIINRSALAALSDKSDHTNCLVAIFEALKGLSRSEAQDASHRQETCLTTIKPL